MKNIFVGYERGNGISPYFAGAHERKLSFSLFSSASLSPRLIKIAIKLAQFHLSFLYKSLLGDWVKQLEETSQIMFTASREVMPAMAYLQKKYPQIKCHVFYLNTLSTEVADVAEWKKYHCELWTFDQNDASRFQMNLSKQPICKESFEGLEDEKVKYDVVFVGEDKKRLPELLELEKNLESEGINTHFHITCTYLPNKSEGISYKYASPIKYEQVLQFYAQSKAVLEILQEGQVGASMRPIEAGYLGKKLITNNPSVIAEPYYHPNNIFVLTKENVEEIPAFLEKEFVSVFDYGIYEMEQWLQRLGKG